MERNAMVNTFLFHVVLMLSLCAGSAAAASPSLGYTELWRQVYDPGSINHGVPGNVAVDRSGNVVMASTYQTSYILVTRKYDEKGALLWSRSYDKSQAKGVVTDELGNIYVVGARHNGVTGVAYWDILLIKYNADGDLMWAKQYGELGFHQWSNEYGLSIVKDAEGDLYLAGFVSYGAAVSSNALCVKLNSDGAVLWAKSYNTGNEEQGGGVAVDAAGNVFLAGYVKTSANYDLFINKYDPAGNFLWERRYDGGGNDFGARCVVDAAGNVYVAGQTEVAGAPAGLIVKFSPGGDRLWSALPGGSMAHDMAIDDKGVLFVAGAIPNGTASDLFIASHDRDGAQTGFFVGTAVKGARGIAVSPDGNNLYVATDTWKTYHSYGVNYVTVRLEKDGAGYIAFPALLPPALINTPYEQSLAVKGGTPPYAWFVTAGELPPGMTLDGAGGVIGGVAAEAGRFDFTVQASDAAGVILSKAMTLHVAEPVTIIDEAPLTGLVGTAYAFRQAASGGLPPYAWSLRAGALPPGLLLDTATGLISGTPTTAGEYPVTIRCAGALSVGQERTFSIRIEDWKSILDGGSGSNERGKAVTVDDAGNVYVVGELTNYYSSMENILTMKYDGAGNLLWQQTYNGGDYDYGNAVAVDGSGNVFVAGTDNNRCVLLKYDGAGSLLWTRLHAPGVPNYCLSVAVDGAGNAYAFGHIASVSTSGAYTYDFSLIKYDSQGNQLWSEVYDAANGWDTGSDIVIDAVGDIYAVGQSGGGSLLLKYNAAGVWQWTRPLTGTARRIAMDGNGRLHVLGNSSLSIYDGEGNQVKSHYGAFDATLDMTVDRDGNIYLTGYSAGSGTKDYYTRRHDAAWNEIWFKQFDRGKDDTAYGIAVDRNGIVYVTGESANASNTDAVTLRYHQPRILSSTLPPGEAGAVYHAALEATGGLPPYAWSIARGSFLPQGLVLNGATGEISGSPLCGGVFHVGLVVANLNGLKDMKTIDLVLAGAGGGQEICDGIDNDCNGLVDDADPNVTGRKTWYQDYDRDGFGSSTQYTLACIAPYGYIAESGDCDDLKAAIKPGAIEVCDNADNDCNGLVDDADPNVTGTSLWYRDADNDYYGDPNVTATACRQPAGYRADNRDCNDADPDINPGYPEFCNDGIDNNCNGILDSGESCSLLPCSDTSQCGPGDYCRKLSGYCGGDGLCEPRPLSCSGGITPVCGCDGATYDSECDAAMRGVAVAANGPCRPTGGNIHFFPSIRDNDAIGWENHLTVQAREPVPMDLRIRVFGMGGALLGTYIYSDFAPDANAPSIAPYARVAQRPSMIVGTTANPVAVEGSMIVETSVPAIATTNTIANSFEGFSIYEAAKPRSMHNFPKAFDGPNNYQVYMLVQNIHATPVTVTAALYGKNATSPGHGAKKTYTIPAHGTLKFRPAIDIAGGVDFSGSVTISSDGATPGDGKGPAIPAMCRYELGREAMTIYESTMSQPELYFPTMMDGKFGGTMEYQNYLSVVNPNSAAVTVEAILYGNNGVEQGTTGPVTLPADGKVTWRPSMIRGTVTSPIDFEGSVVVTSTAPVVGQTNTMYPGANLYQCDAFDLLESALAAPSLFFPKAFDNIVGTGHLYDNFVYVQNPDGAAKTIRIQQFNNNGTPNGERTVPLAGSATYVFRPRDLVTDGTAQFRGSVRVTETGGAAITGAIKYDIHQGATADTPVDAMTLYRSMGQ